MAMAVSCRFSARVRLISRFILEGIPAVIWGVLTYFYMPDYPETAKFLTEEERKFAVDRMGPFAPKGTDKHFDKKDFIKTLSAWEFWAFALTYFFLTNSLNAFGFFAPTIIANLGFKGCKWTADPGGAKTYTRHCSTSDRPAKRLRVLRHHFQLLEL